MHTKGDPQRGEHREFCFGSGGLRFRVQQGLRLVREGSTFIISRVQGSQTRVLGVWGCLLEVFDTDTRTSPARSVIWSLGFWGVGV